MNPPRRLKTLEEIDAMVQVRKSHARCRKCGQVSGATPHKKYCGTGDDRDNHHEYVNESDPPPRPAKKNAVTTPACVDCGGPLDGRVDNVEAHANKAICVRTLQALLAEARKPNDRR